MPGQNFVSGKIGYVTVGNTQYSFGKWKCAMKAKLPNMNNFNGGGFQQIVSGIVAGNPTFEGPWDIGNTPLAVGVQYTFLFGVTPSVFIQVVGIVEDITPSNDVDDAPRVSVAVQSNGSFTAAIV